MAYDRNLELLIQQQMEVENEILNQPGTPTAKAAISAYYSSLISAERAGTTIYTVPPPTAAAPGSGVTSPSPVTPSPAPAPTITFSANTWGSTVPIIWGAIRCPGYYIWVRGIQSGTTVTLGTPYISFAVAFGYPLFSDETVTVNRIWASGNLIYDATQTPAALVPGISWTLYQGDEDQEPDPSIVADRGNVTPAFRGMRYMVFDRFPLSASGNAAPDISVEFATGSRVNLSDVYSAVAARAAIDTEIDNIDDQIDGGLIAQDLTIAQFFRDQSIIYNFAICDGDPIRLVRRPVGDALTVDLEVDISELIQSSATDPVITFQRFEQTAIPNQVQITYIEATVNFQSSLQYARRPFFPIRQTISSAIQRFTIPFVQLAIETLANCYDTLYRAWTQQLSATFVLSALHLDIEAGDVVQVDTGEGTFVLRVVESDLDPVTWTNQISGASLLVRSGVSANADAGQLPNIVTALPYPNCIFTPTAASSMLGPIIVNGRIWTSGNDFNFGGEDWFFVGGDTSIPGLVSRRFIVTVPIDLGNAFVFNGLVADSAGTLYCNMGDTGLLRAVPSTGAITQLDLSSFLTDADTETVQVLADDSYIYLVCNRTGSNSGSGSFSTITSPGLFVARVDLSLFAQNATAVQVLFIPGTDTPPGGATHRRWSVTGACIAQGKLLIAAATWICDSTVPHGADNSTVFSVDLSNFSTVTSAAVAASTDYAHFLGPGVSDGTYAYFTPCSRQLQNLASGAGETIPLQFNGGRVDPTSVGSTGWIEFFDAADDSNVGAVSEGGTPWMDGTYLYFLANNKFPSHLNIYIARRKLSDLSLPVVATGDNPGFDLHGWLNANGFDPTNFAWGGGTTDGSFHYVCGERISQGTGVVIKISQDLTQAANYIAAGCIPPPRNDAFANAVPIGLGQELVGTNVGATRESGEPEPIVPTGDVPDGEASVWFNFTPLSNGTYTVTLDDSKSISISGSTFNPLIGVYTGDAVGSLTHVASNTLHTNNVSFTGVSGTRYRISVSGFNYDIGSIAITVT